jgi:hypothetical protein
MAIDERLEALTMNLKLLHGEVRDLKNVVQMDGENIRGVARIAEIHERRLSHIEGEEP